MAYKSQAEKARVGKLRSRDHAAMIAELGVADLAEAFDVLGLPVPRRGRPKTEPKPREPKRMGRPPKSIAHHLSAGTYRPDRHGRRLREELGVDDVEDARRILGLPPRNRRPAY